MRRGLRRSRARLPEEGRASYGIAAGFYVVAAAGRLLRATDGRTAPVDVTALSPILIAAPPRSGTTLVHRMLAADPRFRTPTLLETLLPSTRVSRWAADPPRWLTTAARATERSFARFDDLHRTRLLEPEEDVFLWQRRLTGPAVSLVFPWLHELGDRWFVDDLEPDERDALVAAYTDAVSRWMAGAAGTTLLLKNTHAAGSLHALAELWPRLRIINIARDPAESVPSSVRLMQRPVEIRQGRRFDSTRPEWRALADISLEYHRRLAVHARRWPADRWCTIDFRDLVAEPAATVRRVYDHFGIDAEPARGRIDEAAAAAATYRSAGSKLTPADIGMTATEIRRLAEAPR